MLEDKQAVLVNNNCSSWYKVGNFSCQLGIGEKKFGIIMGLHAGSVGSILFQIVT